MKRSRFSEKQIIGILKEHQAVLGAKELCRKHGISDAICPAPRCSLIHNGSLRLWYSCSSSLFWASAPGAEPSSCLSVRRASEQMPAA